MRIRGNDHCRVPDYGAGVLRNRLLAKLDAYGRRPTVITGSAGAGKSFLAVQYARHIEANVLWLDAGDVPLSARAVWDLIVLRDPSSGGRGAVVDHDLSPEDAVALVAGAIRREDLGAGVCLVLDNVGTAVDRDAFQSFQRLVSTLHAQGVRLLITTRSFDAWPTSARCDWCIVDEHDLSLRGDEAIGLAGLLGVGLCESDIEEVLGAAAGHVSLCAALSLQTARHGMKSQVRVASLEAWLERVLSELTHDELRLIEYATALKAGTERELLELGVRRPGRLIRRVTARLPLVQAATDESAEYRFRVHDLVDGHFVERGLSVEATEGALGVLQARGDYTRCCELLVRSEDTAASVRWLLEYGETALNKGHVLALDRLFARVAAPQLMSTARVVALWSRVCGQTGRHEESLAKARAARLIAEHERDTASTRAAVVQTLLSLQALSRYSVAYDLAEEVAAAKDEYVDSYLLAEALACMGACRASWGQLRQAEDLFETVLSVCDGEHAATPAAIHARSFMALTPALALGEFETSRRRLLSLGERQMLLPSTRIVLNGNLAVCMAMCGRVDRAETLARGVVSEAELCGLGLYVGAYLPVLAFCCFSRGDVVAGLEHMRRGIEASLEARDASHAAVDRLWMSQMLRAIGRPEESLAEAESAYGVLTRQDELGFRRLAAHEVAAALLACGDSRAARGRIESCGDLAECDNLLHRTAAVLTLAECDRLDGRVHRSLERLEPLSEYLCSESPNLLVAFYARAFPNLLGLVALTVGVENLPVHMLRLIPPESAEIILGETRSWLDDAVWRALGLRLLGEDEFERFLSRDGLPVCHVRFFGALEVTIGGRSIREKDWRKRKARLLFAMLVSRRGYDVPREQIFEHLFADMDPERAKNNLYVSWSTMKSVLLGAGAKGAELPYLEAIGGVCRAVSANIRSDIDDFDKLLASASQHEAAGEYPAALLDYEALSSLYRGELLPGDVYDDWFAELREHYRITFVDAMLSACSLLMDADDPGNALVFARRAIQTDPLREDLYQAALRCQIAAGQRSGAIDTYVQCRSKLADDLGLDPSVETKALYDQILAMEDRPRLVPLDPFVN